MRNLWYKFKEDMVANIVAFVIVMVLSIVSFCLLFFLKGPRNLLGACDACLLATAIPFAALSFYLLNRFGMFDTVGYGFSYFVGMFRFHPQKKYKDLIEYREIKYTSRHKTAYYLPFSLALIITALALVVVYILYRVQFPH
mgnify:CR=1 FL=1